MQLDDLEALAAKQNGTHKKICLRTCMSAGCMSSRTSLLPDLVVHVRAGSKGQRKANNTLAGNRTRTVSAPDFEWSAPPLR